VKEPMDLGTITKRVRADFYGTDHGNFAKVLNSLFTFRNWLI
jgi:hypothetical protein